MMSRSLANRIAENRQKLGSIFKTIVFCGRQNIPMRGHRDSATDLERDIEDTHNHGNFLALLDFRVEAGDTVLGEHLSTADRNAIYTSGNTQNQIIDVLADQVRYKIVGKVKAAIWYTVISDEVTDVSNKEQLTVVLRYVDNDSLAIREDLVGFTECDTGITGRSLAGKVITTLESFNLDLQNLRGQAYDGAGNMAGKRNGLADVITEQYPQALYLHCASHCLNLAVVNSLQVASIKNMMGCLGRVYQFFEAHPKRQRAFEDAITRCKLTTKVHKLKDMCRTRWIQRLDAIDIFQSHHQAIVSCMERICSDGAKLWSADSLTDARGLQHAITTTDFLSSLVITNASLRYIEALTRSLQTEDKDLISAVREIEAVITTLQDVRDNINKYHAEWYLTVEKLCEDVGTVPSIPRLCNRQIHRSNTPATTPSEYYCRTITIPLVDHLLCELKTRFGQHQKTVLLGVALIPTVLLASTIPEEQQRHPLTSAS